MDGHARTEQPTRSPQALYLRLLGRPQLWLDGSDITDRIKYRKGIALLGYLGAHAGERLTREHLADLFWPDLELASARTNLRQVLNNLSVVLNDNGTVLHKDGTSVALLSADGFAMDIGLLSDAVLDRISANTTEARIWRERDIEPRVRELGGDFLAGLQLSGTPDFDAWQEGQRHRYHERGALLLESLCQAQHADGKLTAAIATARHLVSLSPTDENRTHLLMRMLAEAGETSNALEAFATIEQRLRMELGVAPGPDLIMLRDQIAQRVARIDRQPDPQAQELRRLVALYCVSAALQDDAEESDFPEWVSTVVETLGGRVISILGRGVLAVFGHEDYAERPLQRALLAARHLVASPDTSVPEPRIGISAGRVLSRPASGIPHLAGDMLDTAKMIAWTAQPGEILVCATAATQGSEWFRFEPVGAQRFPGLEDVQELFRVAGTAEPANFDDTPLAGRKKELAQLRTCWQAAESGHTTIALLRAPAGLGKTRLASELAREVAARGAHVRRIQCRLEHQHEPLAPVLAELGTRACGRSERPSKSEIFADVFALLDAATATAAVLLLVDDLHWSDFATRELLGQLVPALGQRRLMLLITTRPEITVDFPEGLAHTIELAPLGELDSFSMIAARDIDDAISLAERENIAASSGGIPLFIERKVRSYLEGDHHHAPIAELLQSELDQLGGHKPVLQAAAVLGNRFERRHLLELLPDADVATALARAVDRSLVVRTSAQACTFTHALIRDAAYDNLPASRRKRLHEHAAKLFSAEPDAAPEEIARHFGAAGRGTEAMNWWVKAGDSAMAREFAADAVASYQEALGLIDDGRATADPALARTIRMRLGYAAQMAEGYGSPLTYQLFTDMVAEIEAAPDCDTSQLFAALCGCYMGSSSFGKDDGLIIARRLQTLASSDAERLMACFALGNTLFWRGDFTEAAEWQRSGIALAREIPFAERIRYSIDDLAITCHAIHCWTLWFLGEEAAACSAAEETLQLARQGKRTHTLCFALIFGACLHWCRGDVSTVAALAGEARVLARHFRFPLWEGISSLFLLWAQAASGDVSGVEQLFGAAAMLQQAIKGRATTSRWIVVHALIADGEWQEAEKLLDTALHEIEFQEEQYCLADLQRLKAQCLKRRGRIEAACDHFKAGEAVAHEQCARGLYGRFDADAERAFPQACERHLAAAAK